MKTVNTSGKRKQSIARATLREGKGVIRVNSQLITCYEPHMHRMRILEPLLLAGDLAKKVDIDVNVSGGGVSSQADAARLAIARSLVKYANNAKLENEFLDYDRHLLVADVRRKEVNKPNRSKARAKRQKSYR
jgi:small subunit ribosomal protein S9